MPFVGVQLGRAPAAWAATGADAWDAADERLKTKAVVHVGAGGAQGQGQSVAAVMRWVFDPFLPVSGPLVPLGGLRIRSRTATSPAHRGRRVRRG